MASPARYGFQVRHLRLLRGFTLLESRVLHLTDRYLAMYSETDQTVVQEAAEGVIELGNGLAENEQEAHLWDIADGLLVGAVQYWLYARQPCDDPECEECAPVNTAERRLAELLGEVRRLAEESEYYHSPNDINAGRA